MPLSNRTFSLRRGSSLDFDSWDASGVFTLVFTYGKKWCRIQSLTATLTGKMAELDHLSLIRCLIDA